MMSGGGVTEPGTGAAEQHADEPDGCLNGAQEVLGAFAGGRGKAQPLAEAMLGPAERWHQEDARRQERDGEPVALQLPPIDQLGGRFVEDVGDEHEEAARHPLLSTLFGGHREPVSSGQPDDDDDGGGGLDGGPDGPGNDADGVCLHPGDDPEHPLGQHPHQADARQPARSPGGAQPGGFSLASPRRNRGHEEQRRSVGLMPAPGSQRRGPLLTGSRPASVSEYITIFPLAVGAHEPGGAELADMMGDQLLRALAHPREVADTQLAAVAQRKRGRQTRRISESLGPLSRHRHHSTIDPRTAQHLRPGEVETYE